VKKLLASGGSPPHTPGSLRRPAKQQNDHMVFESLPPVYHASEASHYSFNAECQAGKLQILFLKFIKRPMNIIISVFVVEVIVGRKQNLSQKDHPQNELAASFNSSPFNICFYCVF